MVKRVFLFSCALFFVISSFAVETKTSSKALRYPFIKEVSGDVMLTLVNGEKRRAIAKEPLIEKATLQTAKDADVTVQLDEDRQFRVMPGSELLIPSISYESQQAPLLILKFGSIRWWTPYPYRAAYNVAISSDLFQFILPAGEYSLAMDPNMGVATVKVFEGKLEFSALNAEQSVVVNKGQKSGFQGVLEEGAIAYDVLLKGKKIPRGKLLPLESIDPNEVREFERIQKEKEAAVKKAAAKVAAEKARLLAEGYICKSPMGKFNQCAWLSGAKSAAKKGAVAGAPCVRVRCNANGEWAEKTEVPAEKARILCKSPSAVGPCDY